VDRCVFAHQELNCLGHGSSTKREQNVHWCGSCIFCTRTSVGPLFERSSPTASHGLLPPPKMLAPPSTALLAPPSSHFCLSLGSFGITPSNPSHNHTIDFHRIISLGTASRIVLSPSQPTRCCIPCSLCSKLSWSRTSTVCKQESAWCLLSLIYKCRPGAHLIYEATAGPFAEEIPSAGRSIGFQIPWLVR
jgi:hypothetical protein